MKYKFKILPLFLLVLFCFACQEKTNESLPKKIKVGTIRVPDDKTVAYELRFFNEFFEDKGIELEFIFFDSGTAANVALASGDLDFAEMGYTNAVVALNRNINVELIWLHEVLGENEALVVKQNSNIKKLSDLKGKKVATPFSSTSHYSLMKVLELSGVKSTELHLLDMNTEDILAAWNRGDIDACYTWEPTLSEIKKTGDVLVDSAEMAGKGVTAVNIELVNKAFAKKYPQLVCDYLKALNKAVNTFKQKPDTAINAAAKYLAIDVSTVKKQMSGSIWLTAFEQMDAKYLGTENEPGAFRKTFLETAKFLVNEKKIDKVPNLEEIDNFINTEYLEMLKNTNGALENHNGKIE